MEKKIPGVTITNSEALEKVPAESADRYVVGPRHNFQGQHSHGILPGPAYNPTPLRSAGAYQPGGINIRIQLA